MVLVRSAGQSLDERLLRFARTRGHGDPRIERAMAGFSRLGEHGGIWLALGAVGWALDRPREADWRRAVGTVAGTYALNTAVKLLVRRRRPRSAGSARADRYAHAAELSQRPRLDLVRRRALLRAPGAARAGAVWAGGGSVGVAAVPGGPLSLGRARRGGAGTAVGMAVRTGRARRSRRDAAGSCEHEDRHRGDAQRGQVLAVQRAHQGGC